MKILVVHNIMSPYKTLLFNALCSFWRGEFVVCYFSRTSVLRDWKVEEDKMQYPLYVLSEKRWEETSAVFLSWKLIMMCFWLKPDCILLGEYSAMPYWAAWIYGRLFGKRLFAMVESQGQDHPRKGTVATMKARLKRLFLTHCEKVMVAGEKHKAYVVSLGISEEHIVIMGGVGGVDRAIYAPYLAQYDTVEKRRGIAALLGIPERSYFLYVGRFAKEKNVFTLLDAYRKSDAAKKGWGLLLVGSGPQESELRRYISDKGIKNVVFPGFIQQEQLPLYYLASTVFVLPSLSEPWGLVVDEAITMGLPVLISNRCGCVPDIVKEGENGFVFSPDDVQALTEAMQKMMGSSELEKMRMASLRISQSCSPSISAKHIAEGLLRAGDGV